MKQRKQKDFDPDNHDWEAINTNRKTAEAFAEEFDPFRKLMDELKERVAAGIMSWEETRTIYNPMDHDIMKITAFETRIEFVIRRATNSQRTTVSHALGYEDDTWKFKQKLEEAYNFFKKQIE